MAKRVTSIGFDPHILSALEERGMLGPTVNRDLGRLYFLYDRALRRLDLTVEEACLIVDALNGTIHDNRTALMFSFGVEDAIDLDGLDEKWGVDGKALKEKLSTLDEITCMAVVDAAERFWYNEKYRNKDIRHVIKEVFKIGEKED